MHAGTWCLICLPGSLLFRGAVLWGLGVRWRSIHGGVAWSVLNSCRRSVLCCRRCNWHLRACTCKQPVHHKAAAVPSD